MTRDGRVQWQMFIGIAAFIAVIDVIYWFVSYERAGTTMLTLASCLAALIGTYLYVQNRRRPLPADDPSLDHRWDTHEGSEEYLPTTSWWPLVIGVGVALALNGLILSWPLAVPGAIVICIGIGGFVTDSRRRA